MKVGILTYHSSDNYGAFLQSYALATALQEATGHNVEIIDYTMRKAASMNRTMVNFNRREIQSFFFNLQKYRMFINARKKWLPLSGESLVSDDMTAFSAFVNRQQYDVVIVGSDEVWKMDGYRGFPNPYWLPEIKTKYKIAYAVSARNEINKLSDSMIRDAKRLMDDFTYIGVRDSATEALANDIVSETERIHINCDPTFAYEYSPNKENGLRILKERFGVDPEKKCIGLMCGVPELARRIIREYGDKIQIVSLYYHYRGTKGCCVLDPFEWIDVIAAVDGLITTFFHGMVFAIKNNTDFLAIENRQMENISMSKSFDLLSRNGLEDKCVGIFNEDELETKLLEFVDRVSTNKGFCDFSEIRNNEKKMFMDFVSDFGTLTGM